MHRLKSDPPARRNPADGSTASNAYSFLCAGAAYPRSARATRSPDVPLRREERVESVDIEVLVSEFMLPEPVPLRFVGVVSVPRPAAALLPVPLALPAPVVLPIEPVPEPVLGEPLMPEPVLDEPVALPAPVVLGALPLGADCVLVLGPGVSLAEAGLPLAPVLLGVLLVCA